MKRYITAAASVAALLIVLLPLLLSSGCQGSRDAGGDYFEALDWIGQWDRGQSPDRPLRVALDPSAEAGGPKFKEAVATSLRQWHDLAGVHFAVVPLGADGADQDLRIVRSEIPHLGWTTVERDGGREPFSGRLQWAIVRVHSGIDGAQLEGVLRHELGHALGLGGHSPQRGDVMHEAAPVRARPTPRDVRTYERVQEYAAAASGEASRGQDAPATIDVFCD